MCPKTWHRSIVSKETRIKELEEELARKNEEIIKLEKEIEEKEKRVKELEKEIIEKNAQISELTNQVEGLNRQLNELNTKLSQTDATANKILKDYKAYSNGQLITGSMENIGAVNQTLNAGESYTIPEGYHNGNGTVTAASLVNQTQATATEEDIAEGKTAWVNGAKITGTKEESSQSDIGFIKQEGSTSNNKGMSQVTYFDVKAIKTLTLKVNNCYNYTYVKVLGYTSKENLTEGKQILNYNSEVEASKTINVSEYEAISITCQAGGSGPCSMYVITGYTKK